MTIRRATLADVERIMEIYSIAVGYMKQCGNPSQWINGYPSREIVEADISLERLFVVTDKGGAVVAQFCYFVGEDPTYNYIEGEWLNNMPYGVVHRLASSGEARGVAHLCLDWCFERHPNMRVDTHHDNLNMQRILRESGYRECGEIIVANGSRRVAFHRVG